MKQVKILWIISHPKYEVMLEFQVSKILKWIITKLMKKRKISIKQIKKNQLRGYKANVIYVDEVENKK